MGTQDVTGELESLERRRFTKHLLKDLRALEQMLEQGSFEVGNRRIGAEQELFLIDRSWRAAPVAEKVLAEIDDPHFTTELAQFNLEFNCDPLLFGGTCLQDLETQMTQLMGRARSAAAKFDTQVVLAGILPTLHKSDLELSNMTRMPRYAALNEALTRERGDAYSFRIRGIDELSFKHYSVMLEACNTSFQVHFQVAPSEFARLYNFAQAVAAPVLAVATNSPLLFGKRLWSETRIALFQQSIDTRTAGHHLRDLQPRVRFGSDWVEDSVLEIFREDISRFKALLGTRIEEDPFESLGQGRAPKLQALSLHNSTVYRWNRPCYGITDGKPHLRIENRVLPAGPTLVDEVANAAFWFGLLSGLAGRHDDVRDVFSFDHAVQNFFAASRQGLEAQFTWFDRRQTSASELILKELLPVAREGLAASGIAATDSDRYLGVIEERTRSRQTGSAWLVDSLAGMGGVKGPTPRGERLGALTAAMVTRQASGEPVHRWPLAEQSESGGWQHNFVTVEQFMVTDLFTAHEDESIDMVANLMDWRRIRHIPVEDREHRLVGLVTYRELIRYLARNSDQGEYPDPVSTIMTRDPVTATPETSSLEAIELMRRRRISCLPVVKDEHLVGIVTEADFTRVAGELLEAFLRGQHRSDNGS